jgi:hypothetical protein
LRCLCLEARGFSGEWCQWMIKVLYNRIVAIKLNDQIAPYFQSYKGVRQGDPLSPILFNFVADSLTRMVITSQQANLVTGLVPHIIPMGLVVL